MRMKTFRRRIYHSLADLRADFGYISGRRHLVRRAMRTGGVTLPLISPAFRERLMLAVTEVNGCRYCSYYHA